MDKEKKVRSAEEILDKHGRGLVNLATGHDVFSKGSMSRTAAIKSYGRIRLSTHPKQ
jgi:hypothetical protein